MASIADERVDTAAEAAGEEGAEVEEPPLKKSKPVAEAGPGSKKIAGARLAVEKARAALTKKVQAVANLESKSHVKSLKKTDRERLASLQAEILKLQRDLPTLEKNLEETMEWAKALAASLKAKEEEKAEKVELARAFSDVGGAELVELVTITYAKKLENNTDTSDAVWQSAIAPAFMKKVESGELPATDGRGWKALKDR